MNQPTRHVKNPPPRCNEIVMIEGSEPVKSSAQQTGRAALQAWKEWNKVEHFQNAATPHCVLIIRRSEVRVLLPPPTKSIRLPQRSGLAQRPLHRQALKPLNLHGIKQVYTLHRNTCFWAPRPSQ